MSLSIEVLDLSDHNAYREFYQAYRQAQVPDVSHPFAEHELSVELIGNEFVRFEPVVARDGEGIVGVAIIQNPEKDNLTTAYLEVFTVPHRRRQGIGSRLLEFMESRCREDGRTQVLAETLRNLDAESSAGGEFLKAKGYHLDTLIVQSELPLPVSVAEPTVMDGFRLQSWRGLPPAIWIDAYAQLMSLLNQEAPSGETELENEFWDAARLRAQEADWQRQRRTSVTAVAITDDEQLAGHTQLVFPAESETAFQWDTLILPAYRGKGLGLSLKQQALLTAGELLEPCQRIVTWNDASNEHMLRLNTDIGYRQTAWLDQWVKYTSL